MDSKKLYDFGIFSAGVLIWSLIVAAKYADYDLNIVFFFIAAILSIKFSLFLILTAIFNRRQIFFKFGLSAILFLITSSPVSIYLITDFIGFSMKS